MRLSDRRRTAAEEELTVRFGRALDYVQRQVAARAAEVATTIVAAGTQEEQDDDRKWGALPLATAAASVDPAAVYDPTWWRKGYSRHVRRGVNGLYDDTVTRASGELGVAFDPDDPMIADALDELDGETAESWGAGLPDFVAGQVRASAADGDTVGGLVARLKGADESWFSVARAALLASVAVATTYNRAALAAGTSARAQGTSSTKTWTSVGDDKVRDTHQEMDGQSVDVGEDFMVAGAYPAAGPHDARLPIEEVANCFPADVLVAAPSGVVGTYRRYYSGCLVVVETAGGAKLAATPNHPVLTGSGWRPIGSVQPGDQVIRCGVSQDDFTLGREDEHHRPSTIGEVVEAFSRHVLAVHGVVGAGINFHGDRPDGDVDIVRTDRPLLLDSLAPGAERIGDLRLSPSDVALAAVLADSSVTQLDVGSGFLATTDVRCGGESAPPFEVGPRHTSGMLLCTASDRNSLPEKPARERTSGNSAFSAEGLWGLPVQIAADVLVGLTRSAPSPTTWASEEFRAGGSDSYAISPKDLEDGVVRNAAIGGDLHGGETPQVFLDEVSVVRREQWQGYVHNLETSAGWYLANSIPVRNCRCWVELSSDGGNVADETTSVDDSDVTYETDGSEEDALVASPSLGGGGLAVLDRIKPSVQLTTVWPAPLGRFYSDDQPRDDHGRWGEGSGGGDSSSGPGSGAQVAPPASRDAIDAAKAYLVGGDAQALKDATGGNGVEYDRAMMTARNELAHDAAHDEFHPDMSRAEYERAVLDKTRADLDGPIVMRVSEETLGKVLGDGRFRTQYEVRGRTGGGEAGTIREQKDGVLFGQGSGTPSDQRMVYGSVSTGGLRSANDGVQWEPGPNGVGPTSLDSYGKVQVVLNDDVRDRASYSYGDSFDGRAQPAPINEPSLNALPAQDPYQRADKLVDPLSINVDSNEFRSWNYLEVQVPGVSTADIKEVVFPANPAAGTADRLKEAGISWRVL